MNSKIVNTDFKLLPKETTDTLETILFVAITKNAIGKSKASKILPCLEEVARRNNYNLRDSIDRMCADIVLLNYVLAN